MWLMPVAFIVSMILCNNVNWFAYKKLPNNVSFAIVPDIPKMGSGTVKSFSAALKRQDYQAHLDYKLNNVIKLGGIGFYKDGTINVGGDVQYSPSNEELVTLSAHIDTNKRVPTIKASLNTMLRPTLSGNLGVGYTLIKSSTDKDKLKFNAALHKILTEKLSGQVGIQGIVNNHISVMQKELVASITHRFSNTWSGSIGTKISSDPNETVVETNVAAQYNRLLGLPLKFQLTHNGLDKNKCTGSDTWIDSDTWIEKFCVAALVKINHMLSVGIKYDKKGFGFHFEINSGGDNSGPSAEEFNAKYQKHNRDLENVEKLQKLLAESYKNFETEINNPNLNENFVALQNKAFGNFVRQNQAITPHLSEDKRGPLIKACLATDEKIIKLLMNQAFTILSRFLPEWYKESESRILSAENTQNLEETIQEVFTKYGNEIDKYNKHLSPENLNQLIKEQNEIFASLKSIIATQKQKLEQEQKDDAVTPKNEEEKQDKK
jgi:hypothetical protein